MANRYKGKMGRGASRLVKQDKRKEAEQRNLDYQLRRAVQSSEAGEVVDLGDFTQYAESS